MGEQVSERKEIMRSEQNEDVALPLEVTVADLLKKKGLTITCAESCTGGLLSGRIVNVPGVSDVYKAGVVTYANEAKEKFLGVKKSTLEAFGAVSRQTAEEMVKGAIAFAEADAALAVTGIAGPDGGTPEKPVGLVYIACDVQGVTVVEEHHFSGNRREVREATVEAALMLLKKCIEMYCGDHVK